jgi:acetylornithine/N-succinyldiaminopimelate aminotransferase
LGLAMRQRLAELQDRYPAIIDSIRGEGLMFGVKTKTPVGDFVAAARDAKLLTIPAAENVVRLLPPLIVDENEIAEAVRRLDAACAKLESSAPATLGADG